MTSAKLADDAITSRIYQRTAVSADNGSALPKELTASCDAGDAVIGGGFVADAHGQTGVSSVIRNYAVDARTWLVRLDYRSLAGNPGS